MKGGEINNILSNIYNSLFSNLSNNSIVVCLLSLFLCFVVIIYTLVILFTAKKDGSLDTIQTEYTYIGLIVIPIVFIFFLILQVFTNNAIAYNTIILLAILGISATITVLLTYVSVGYINFFKGILYVLLTLILFLSLSLYAAVFVNDMRRQNNWFGFFINFIFYLPCLFVGFINKTMVELRLTPRPVLVLLFFEILVILAYFLLPYIFNQYINSNGITILNDAVKLNNETMVISGYDLFNKVFSKEIVDYESGKQTEIKFSNSQPLMNYSISMWVFVNPQNESFSEAYNKKNETPIFRYGNGNDMKPMVSYYNNLDNNKNAYRFYFSKIGGNPDYELTLPVQKWINFVITYNNSIVDLFVDGELTRTFSFTDAHPVPVYNTFMDDINVGESNGLQGAIANIVLYKIPLTKSQIAANYNLYIQSNKIK
jgi:hypothetical protein